MKQTCISACWRRAHWTALFMLALSLPTNSAAQLHVIADPALPSGQPVGTRIILFTEAEGATSLPAYRFEYRLDGSDWRLLRDYSRFARFDWVPLEEGLYEIRVTAIDLAANDMSSSSVPFQITPRGGNRPMVTATSNPLVALYSAPSCWPAAQRVRFRRQGSSVWQHTNFKPCRARRSFNIYIAGMIANTDYEVQHELVRRGRVTRGPLLPFRTGVPEVPFPKVSVDDPPMRPSFQEPLLLSGTVLGESLLTATTARDLLGNVVWYYEKTATPGQTGANLARPVAGGTFLFNLNDGEKWQVLREIDLAGNVVRETSAFAVSLQLLEMGQDLIGSIHHEALRLDNGHTLILGSVEREIEGDEQRFVLGDMVVELDQNFQVAWVWNSFDHLDVERRAVLGETCTHGQPGCPPLWQFDVVEDWTHSNSIGYNWLNGSLIVSVRHQDWVVAIDYANGNGTGEILWTLGRDGDFDYVNGGAFPWFTHQHDAEIQGLNLVVFDNGNTRVSELGEGNSRGQVLALDTTSMTARLVINTDLGVYSRALGAAERLSNGNYHFSAGALSLNGDEIDGADSVETSARGVILYRNRTLDVGVYRHFRIKDLYTAP